MYNFSSSPNKFGPGIGLLWRGLSIYALNQILSASFASLFGKRRARISNTFLFESARTALYHLLRAHHIGLDDEVIVSSFTCSAVTYAVQSAGSKVVYVDVNDDLTMDEMAVFSAITPKTKAVIVQNSFGRLGLAPKNFLILKNQGLLVIEDCALSFGSHFDGVPHGLFGDISIWSLEASKSFTIGWGGVLTVNDLKLLRCFQYYYASLKSVPILPDLLRIFQLWISVYFVTFPAPFGMLLWYFFYGVRLFRRSVDSQCKYYNMHPKLGPLSSLMFYQLQDKLPELCQIAHNNYKSIEQFAIDLDLNPPFLSKSNEFVVTPRFSLYIKGNHRMEIIKEASLLGVELGYWFDESPPSYRLKECRISSATKARKASDTIVNFTCHWTTSSIELKKIEELMIKISSISSHANVSGDITQSI